MGLSVGVRKRLLNALEKFSESLRRFQPNDKSRHQIFKQSDDELEEVKDLSRGLSHITHKVTNQVFNQSDDGLEEVNALLGL